MLLTGGQSRPGQPEADQLGYRMPLQEAGGPELGHKERGDDGHEEGADEPPLDGVRVVPIEVRPPHLVKVSFNAKK